LRLIRRARWEKIIVGKKMVILLIATGLLRNNIENQRQYYPQGIADSFGFKYKIRVYWWLAGAKN
jgi:hypothetical protein